MPELALLGKPLRNLLRIVEKQEIRWFYVEDGSSQLHELAGRELARDHPNEEISQVCRGSLNTKFIT